MELVTIEGASPVQNALPAKGNQNKVGVLSDSQKKQDEAASLEPASKKRKLDRDMNAIPTPIAKTQ